MAGAFQTKVEAAWCNSNVLSLFTFLCHHIAISDSEGLSLLAASSLTMSQQFSSPQCHSNCPVTLTLDLFITSLFSPFHFKRLYSLCLSPTMCFNFFVLFCFGLHSGFSGHPAVGGSMLLCSWIFSSLTPLLNRSERFVS